VHAEAVDDALATLEKRFGPFPVHQTEWHVDEATYEETADRAATGTVGGAGAWVRRERDGGTEALLVREEELGGWSEPAGKQEPGEPLGATACRETREETGVECRLTGVLRAVQALHVVDDGDRPPIPRLVVAFDADYLSGEPTPKEDEIDEVAWWSEHPDELRYPEVAKLPIG
jgi:ADP-ribose pyrophosphatase YjhB (NUDIX family)